MAELGRHLRTARDTFLEKLSEVDQAIQALFGEWDRAVDAGTGESEQQKLYQRMNEALNRRSYIRNLVQNVQKELAEE